MLKSKLLGATAAAELLAIEDVFSTYLYTGNGSTQTITNGIDLAGEGGLVWIKGRGLISGSTAADHVLIDSARGVSKVLYSNLTSAESSTTWGTSFNSDGFSFTTASGYVNSSSMSVGYASWTWRKAPRWFDCVTYTGTGANRTVAHDLGVVPGCIIIKETSATRNWYVYHRSTGNTKYLYLNLTDAAATSSLAFNNTDPTATEFTVGTINGINNSGASYVAYLFAHDPLGPSGDGSDGLIACGVYSGNALSDGPEITLGWEPQWVMVKSATGVNSPWNMYDTMRGMVSGYVDAKLQANTSDAEQSTQNFIRSTATGFKIESADNEINNDNSTYIYIAIRRGPMREPTSGTEVFAVDNLPSSVSQNQAILTSGFPVDANIRLIRSGGAGQFFNSRVTGSYFLISSSTGAELGGGSPADWDWDSNTGIVKRSTGTNNYTNQTAYSFRRAPGFFDVVAYTGQSSSGRQKTHNLGVAPELLIVKSRSNIQAWSVLCTLNGGLQGRLNENTALSSPSAAVWGDGTSYVPPTDSIFTVGTDNETNATGWTYIAYLFATLPGISKVGSYTGNGTTLDINCGFTSGARFVLIKGSSFTHDWHVFDTARGIVAGNDPFLELNTTNAENASYDAVDPLSSGFTVNQTMVANLNASGATYIFLAIA